MADSPTLSGSAALQTRNEQAISLAREVVREYQLTDLQPLLDSVKRQATREYLNVAVFGRFKAGKSSFLNFLLGRPILPVGVVPVTTVVTEICYGPQDSAEVAYLNGRTTTSVSLSEIASYISESDNPANRLGVRSVRVSVPEMAPYRQLRLVDTPGLESILAHNAEASFAWSPNTDLALVAIGVDPPLTQQDVALIERLRQFTPNVSVLLTKMDLLNPSEQLEVLSFVGSQLASKFQQDFAIFPFSIKPGHAEFQERFKKEFFAKTLASFDKSHNAALAQKLRTLLTSMSDYLQLALKSAEAREADHGELRQEVLGPQQALDDTRLQFRLLSRHASAGTRPFLERRLQQSALARLQKALEERLFAEFPGWHGSFAKMLRQFETWLRQNLESELTQLSAAESTGFLEPLRDMQRQCQRVLQSLRAQLSDRVLRAFGVPLHTVETEIAVQSPRAPDLHLSRIFDHDWQLLSPLLPMFLFRGLLRQRFAEKVESEVFKNLSRLTSQWEEAIHAAIRSSEAEALHRFDELVSTVQRLLSVESLDHGYLLRDRLRNLKTQMESFSASKNGLTF